MMKAYARNVWAMEATIKKSSPLALVLREEGLGMRGKSLSALETIGMEICMWNIQLRFKSLVPLTPVPSPRRTGARERRSRGRIFKKSVLIRYHVFLIEKQQIRRLT
jgi:hypothetical protein